MNVRCNKLHLLVECPSQFGIVCRMEVLKSFHQIHPDSDALTFWKCNKVILFEITISRVVCILLTLRWSATSAQASWTSVARRSLHSGGVYKMGRTSTSIMSKSVFMYASVGAPCSSLILCEILPIGIIWTIFLWGFSILVAIIDDRTDVVLFVLFLVWLCVRFDICYVYTY